VKFRFEIRNELGGRDMGIRITWGAPSATAILVLGLLISGCEGDDGAAGAAGPPGADGISCWDLNQNGIADPEEDINGDGVVDVFDCQAPPPSAAIIPGVNTAFDSITEVATSATANGTYDAVSDFTYDAATETITLGAGSVPSGGLFVRITGDATLGGVTSSYTLYTFVASNDDIVAANELTSLAVGYIAEGTAGDFAAAVDVVAADTFGVDSASITAPSTEAGRDPAVRASMIAISNEFENAGFVPGTSSASTVNGAIAQCMALGGLAYDNWTKLNAGGNDLLPACQPLNPMVTMCVAKRVTAGIGSAPRVVTRDARARTHGQTPAIRIRIRSVVI
jgi:hypothetical protein